MAKKDNSEGYRVFAIESGQCFGILIGKKDYEANGTIWAYFYTLRRDSLLPNEHISKVCHDRIYPLVPTTDEEVILDLLRKCAEFSEVAESTPETIPIGKVYKRQGQYTRTVPRLFQRKKSTSPLKGFIGSSGAFQGRILTKQGNELVVTAREFGVLKAHEILPEEEIKYLKHVKHFLKIGGGGTPEWFRRTGPVAIDFEEGTVVVRNDRLSQLRDLVMENPFSILQGLAATGKSVLVRNLAYDLYNDGELRVYFFKHRDYNVDELAHLVNSIRGIIIFEDFHLDVLKFQELFSLLRPHSQRHVLFTVRKDFHNFQRLMEYPDLQRLPTINLDPFEDVDRIIDSYASSDGVRVPWSPMAKQKIKEVSRESFWLLAFALEGYVVENGRGDPNEWLESGVREYLEDLGRQNRVFPEVLVALSPLYLNEVMSAESYLIDKLGFKSGLLKRLAQRGEISRQKEDGLVFYGLPHSGLAEACWEHGLGYRRKLPEYEDFIYDYVFSGSPNALEAILTAEHNVRENLLATVSSHELLPSLIRNESSMKTLGAWTCVADDNILARSDVLDALALRMNMHNDSFETVECLASCYRVEETGRKLWDRTDKNQFKQKVSRSSDLFSISKFIATLQRLDKNAALELCEFLDLDTIASLLTKDKIFLSSSLCINTIKKANPIVCSRICNKLDYKVLADNINECENLPFIENFIDDIFEVDTHIMPKLIRQLDPVLLELYTSKRGIVRSYEDENSLFVNVFDKKSIHEQYVALFNSLGQQLDCEEKVQLARRLLRGNSRKWDVELMARSEAAKDRAVIWRAYLNWTEEQEMRTRTFSRRSISTLLQDQVYRKVMCYLGSSACNG